MSRRGFLPPVLGPLVLVHAVVPTDMMEVEESGEPSAKRKKLSPLRVGDETLFHMDLQEIDENMLDFSCEFAAVAENLDFEETLENELTEDSLRQPFSQFEPELFAERMRVKSLMILQAW